MNKCRFREVGSGKYFNSTVSRTWRHIVLGHKETGRIKADSNIWDLKTIDIASFIVMGKLGGGSQHILGGKLHSLRDLFEMIP